MVAAILSLVRVVMLILCFFCSLYTSVPYQLVSADTVDYWSPSLIVYDNGRIILTYIKNPRGDIHDIGSVHMENDGLDISIFPKKSADTTIISPDQWWEGKKVSLISLLFKMAAKWSAKNSNLNSLMSRFPCVEKF